MNIDPRVRLWELDPAEFPRITRRAQTYLLGLIAARMEARNG